MACGASPRCSLGGIREGDHVLVTLATTQWTQARTSITPTEHEFCIHILQRIENLLGRDTEKGGRQRWPRQSNREVPRCPPAGQDGFARVSGTVLRKWSAKRQERERRACPTPPSASERRSTLWRRCPSAFVRPNKALPKEHWGGAITPSGSNARKHEKEKNGIFHPRRWLVLRRDVRQLAERFADEPAYITLFLGYKPPFSCLLSCSPLERLALHLVCDGARARLFVCEGFRCVHRMQ